MIPWMFVKSKPGFSGLPLWHGNQASVSSNVKAAWHYWMMPSLVSWMAPKNLFLQCQRTWNFGNAKASFQGQVTDGNQTPDSFNA